MKGKGDKKGATSKSSSSKSPAKGMSDSFKSKEFVSSDESSSAESKKEVGVAAGGRSWPPSPGEHPGGFRWRGWVLLVPRVCGTWTALRGCPQVPTVTLSLQWGHRRSGGYCPAFTVPC